MDRHGARGSDHVATLLFAATLFMLLGRLGAIIVERLGSRLAGVSWLDHAWLIAFAAIILLVLLSVYCGGGSTSTGFSLHGVYRNRLARAFIGTARPPKERKPDAYTRFDPADNLRMQDLYQGKQQRGIPFPVVNVTLNLLEGAPSGWAERKAAPFTITPCTPAPPVSARRMSRAIRRVALSGPRTTEDRNMRSGPDDAKSGVTLGTAMTISGAAVSPNQGYHSSPATAFLMTLFDVRLGAWLPNPGVDQRWTPANLDFSNMGSASGREFERIVVQQRFLHDPRCAPMQTECTPKLFEFEAVERRSVVAGFDGGNITSNAGALLLGQVDRGVGLVRRFADCFIDRRDPRYVEHQVETLVGQRIFGLALGYEDLNDHDELRKDPTFAVLEVEPGAADRLRTVGRQKHTQSPGAHVAGHASKYHKIDCDDAQVDALLVDLFLEAHERAPREIVLDLDNTDIPLHGEQEGRFFHGYYKEYCYLPLYVFCGRHLLLARQRRANVAGCDGAVEAIARIVAQIRQEWPRIRVILRADSGFCNDELMGWCEANRVDYVFGLARNRRLEAALVDQLAEAKRLCAASGKSARVFRDFRYCTIDSWNRTRRVIGKAEHTLEGSDPRFIVTSLKRSRIAYDARALYEKLYCARGEAENRIGEQFELFADRASSATMAANQLRMSFSAMAYVLFLPCAASVSPSPVRRCRRRDHSPQAAQARGAGAHQRAPHPLRHHLRMSEQGRVRTRPHLSSARLQLCLSHRTRRKHQDCSLPC